MKKNWTKPKKEKTSDTNTKKRTSLPTSMAYGKLFALQAAKWIMVFLAEYVFVILMACVVVPVVVTYIGGASGMMYSESTQDVIIMWLFPALFAVGCLFVAVIWICKKLYHIIGRMFEKSIKKQTFIIKQEKM